MEIDKEKFSNTLDLLRMKLILQRDLTEQITVLYSTLNELAGNIINVPLDQKTKAKPGWGADPNYQKPVTPESQVLRDHQLGKEF